MTRCAECGFEYSSIGPDDVPEWLRASGPAYVARLWRDETVLRQRPTPDVWSALEYACHVRDVLVVQRERLALALAEDCPTFVPMGRDERVVNDRYNEQDPRAVGDQLRVAANEIADAFEVLDDAGWARVGIYNYPEPAERSMLWLAQHTIHEVQHHLTDIDRVLRAVQPDSRKAFDAAYHRWLDAPLPAGSSDDRIDDLHADLAQWDAFAADVLLPFADARALSPHAGELVDDLRSFSEQLDEIEPTAGPEDRVTLQDYRAYALLLERALRAATACDEHERRSDS